MLLNNVGMWIIKGETGEDKGGVLPTTFYLMMASPGSSNGRLPGDL